MSLFSNMNTEGMEQVEDKVGGEFSVLESGIYSGTVKAAYVLPGDGAMGINLILDLAGREYRETIYITTKNHENFFINKKTGNKVPLPGFTLINDLCCLALKKPLAQIETEEKIFKIYDKDAKAELPKSVQTITELTGKDIVVGILHTKEDKTQKNAEGKYVPTGEFRDVNRIDKFFDAETKCTVNELSANKTEPEFLNKWIEKNAGKVRDRTQKNASGTAGAPQKPAASATKSLFG